MKTSQSTRDRNRRWRQNHKDWWRDYWRAWRRANRHKRRAHRAVARAIRRGDLARPEECERCREECYPDAHHYQGYAEPLEVEFLCPGCHSAARKEDAT